MTQSNAEFWKRKLLALLHDPPHKALNVKEHEEFRDIFVRQAGLVLEEDRKWLHTFADSWAAAADRFPLFSADIQSPFGGAEHPFKHPLGGSELSLEDFPSPDLLATCLQATQPHGEGLLDSFTGNEKARVNFFLHWRRWPVEVCKDPKDKVEQRWRAAYLPADTRMPDHPIWLHNSITSALAGTNGKPAFLIFQLGPVQEFIAQARSTRDLWSGSYLLSWLMAHAIKAVSDKIGPDAFIFPFLRAQPLFDLLHRDDIYAKVPLKDVTGQTLWDRLKQHENEMLVPNLPNKFLAVVPAEGAEEMANYAAGAVVTELKKIGNSCWDWIHQRHPMKEDWRTRYDAQIAAFPQITWHVHEWELNSREDVFEQMYGCKLEETSYPPNPGNFWSYHYRIADSLHAGRRNTRDFACWSPEDDKRVGASKDELSGKEEIVGDIEWWQTLPEHDELGHLFRGGDKLGAVNLIKRVWHLAYLEEQWRLKPGKVIRFESVPDISAAEWLEIVKKRTRSALAESPEAFDSIQKLCEAIARNAAAFRIKVYKEPPSDKNILEWISGTAPEAFLISSWTREGQKCSVVVRGLNALYESQGVGYPPAYVAVLAFDGDNMGKWISGKLSPRLVDQFSKEARDKFLDKVKDLQRPLSPSHHLQFSEALANFALYLVRPIVAYFHGQVIYAGGDDVLAMVPAENAVHCALALRNAFRGQGRIEGVYEACGSHGGFVRLLEPHGEQPTWPLIVPGPKADASVGIAIGHCHAPLQNLVEAARRAEKKAKGDAEKGRYGKSAFAISLFKRSGEVIEWGGKWDSKAVQLMERFKELTEAGKLSGRFTYALAALLRPYAEEGWRLEPRAEFDPFRVFPLEFDHVLRQQGNWKQEDDKARQEFFELMCGYLNELRRMNGPDGKLERAAGKLQDLLGPFLTHAFISRRGGK